jgi:hypothetical protein
MLATSVVVTIVLAWLVTRYTCRRHQSIHRNAPTATSGADGLILVRTAALQRASHRGSSRLRVPSEHDLYFLALATDYDGTIAHHGVVDARTSEALQRFKATGRRLILVTGRDLASLKLVFPAFGMYDRIVAENGA